MPDGIQFDPNVSGKLITPETAVQNLTGSMNQVIQQYPADLNSFLGAIKDRAERDTAVLTAHGSVVKRATDDAETGLAAILDARKNIENTAKIPLGLGDLVGIVDSNYNTQYQRTRIDSAKALVEAAGTRIGASETATRNALAINAEPVTTAKSRLEAEGLAMETAGKGIAANREAMMVQQLGRTQAVTNMPFDKLKEVANTPGHPLQGLAQTRLTSEETAQNSLALARVNLEMGKINEYQLHLQRFLEHTNPTTLMALKKQADASGGTVPATDPITGKEFGSITSRDINNAIFAYGQKQLEQAQTLAKQAEAASNISANEGKSANIMLGATKVGGGIEPVEMAATYAEESKKVDVAKTFNNDLVTADAAQAKFDKMKKQVDELTKNMEGPEKAATEHFIYNGGVFTNSSAANTFLVKNGISPQPMDRDFKPLADALTTNLNAAFTAEGRASSIGQGLSNKDKTAGLLGAASFFDLAMQGKVGTNQYVDRAKNMPITVQTDTGPKAVKPADQFHLITFGKYVGDVVRSLVTKPDGTVDDNSPYRQLVDSEGKILDQYKYNHNALIKALVTEETGRAYVGRGYDPKALPSQILMDKLSNPDLAATWANVSRRNWTAYEAALYNTFSGNRPGDYWGAYLKDMRTQIPFAQATETQRQEKSETINAQVPASVQELFRKRSSIGGTFNPTHYDLLIQDYLLKRGYPGTPNVPGPPQAGPPYGFGPNLNDYTLPNIIERSRAEQLEYERTHPGLLRTR